MIVNAPITVYHRGFNNVEKLETWQRYNYDNAWWFVSLSSTNNKEYQNDNKASVRIPYSCKPNVNNFTFGDLLIKGKLDIDITTDRDLKDYQVFKISTINDNNFGSQPHIHLEGN